MQMCIIGYRLNAKHLQFDWLKQHISDSFDCYNPNINGM